MDGGRELARGDPVPERNDGPAEICRTSKEKNREIAWQNWRCNGVHLD